MALKINIHNNIKAIRIFTFYTFTLLIANFGFGQSDEIFFKPLVDAIAVTEKSEVKGTPYVDDDLSPVKINNSDVLYGGRFNAYNGNMEILLNKSETPVVLDLKQDYTVDFVNDSKSYKNYRFTDARGKNVNEFFVTIYAGENVAVLLKESVRFQNVVKANSGYEKDKPAMYIREKDVYYLKVKEGTIIEIPRKSKDLVELFSENQGKIKDFIKDNKIKTNKEEDLISLVKFMDSI